CMSTRSSTRNLFPPLKDPERTIRRRTRVDPNSLNDFEEINMAANGAGDDGLPPNNGGVMPTDFGWSRWTDRPDQHSGSQFWTQE
ncbi:hypothetical protein Tco_1579498, partial [Tanacetum coccineum]